MPYRQCSADKAVLKAGNRGGALTIRRFGLSRFREPTQCSPRCAIRKAVSTIGQLYVSDFLNDVVDSFEINSSSGGLTAITGSPFPFRRCASGCRWFECVRRKLLIYVLPISMPGRLLGFCLTQPAEGLHPFRDRLFPQATHRCKSCKRQPKQTAYCSCT